MIYIFDKPEQFTGKDMKRALFLMPGERRIKIENLRQEEDRRLSILSCLLLFYGLREEYGFRTLPDFSYGSHGKPYFKDYPRIHFNLSHCRAGAACIIAEREAGIDMQDIRPLRPGVAKRVCSDEELTALAKSKRPEEEFAGFWAVKECMGKLIGTGINGDLKSYDIKSCRKHADIELVLRPGRYVLTAAVRREENACIRNTYLPDHN